MEGGQDNQGEKYPSNFHLVNDEGHPLLRRNDLKERFAISNRPFAHIDEFLNHNPSLLLEALINKKKDEPVRVLDIGGGTKSKAADDLTQKYGERIKVFNADIAIQALPNLSVHPIQADATKLPIADETIDLIYSYQLLDFLDKSKNFAKEREVLREISRILAPGGSAVLDETHFSKYKEDSRAIRSLKRELGLDVTRVERSEPMSVYMEWFHRQSYHFLILSKPLNDQHA